MNGHPAIITGIPGWLGNRFLDVMVNGLEDFNPAMDRQIFALYNAEAVSFSHLKSKYKQVEFINGDLRDKASLNPLFVNARGSTVFHIAGVIHPQKVSDFYAINLEGTRNMLELSKDLGVKRFIYVSSNSPCGTNQNPSLAFNEESPYKSLLELR